jgi:TatD DNase family protein
MLIDTHAHLDFPDFAGELDAVIERARAARVDRVIAVGTSFASSRTAVALAERYPGVFATAGFHPNSAEEANEDDLRELRELAWHRKVVAVGEAGLDYYRLPLREEKEDIIQSAFGSASTGWIETKIKEESIKATQAAVFRAQLEIAVEVGKPIIIHQRESWQDTLAILKEYSVRAVIHCFTGTPEQALEALAAGYLISFTGIVTFKNAKTVHAAASSVPLDRLMVETDAPYLAPVPYRGQRCEPAFVRQTAEALAKLKGITFEELASTTTRNAEAFFQGLK